MSHAPSAPPLSHSTGVIVSAPIVPLDVATMASALESTGTLDRLVTGWCFTRSEWDWARRLTLPQSWLRRPQSPVPLARLRRVPSADLRRHFGRWIESDKFRTADQSFRLVDRAAAALVTAQTSAILGREDACLSCFRRGAEHNLPRIYQLPTAHYVTVRKLLSRERDLFPEAFDARELETDFAPERMQRKLTELELATHVLCHSSFVAASLKCAGVQEVRITTIPLGTDVNFADENSQAREPIFLYAGTISARKGVHRLIKIWKQLRAYRTHRLRLIGNLQLPTSFLAEYRSVFEHIPRLPRTSLFSEYAKAQAFIFNALADGFGHVLAEAMASGTPVLASRNSAAPDLINPGEEGWIFDYGDDDALAAALDRALSSPRQLRQMGEKARRRALRWTCGDFASSFLSWINLILDHQAQV